MIFKNIRHINIFSNAYAKLARAHEARAVTDAAGRFPHHNTSARHTTPQTKLITPYLNREKHFKMWLAGARINIQIKTNRDNNGNAATARRCENRYRQKKNQS